MKTQAPTVIGSEVLSAQEIGIMFLSPHTQPRTWSNPREHAVCKVLVARGLLEGKLLGRDAAMEFKCTPKGELVMARAVVSFGKGRI